VEEVYEVAGRTHPLTNPIFARKDGQGSAEDCQSATAAELAAQGPDLAESGVGPLSIALVDCYRFSQECLATAFESLNARLTVVPFASVAECIDRAPPVLDLIIYYSHTSQAADASLMKNVISLREVFAGVPLLVMSDADDTEQVATIRSTLKIGAQGFIPTRTTGIPIAVAAIRFVMSGGIFAPLDLLLTGKSERTAPVPVSGRNGRLTSRQMMVLSHLQQGKANKIIAHELKMSESTVKVHVRNIMRKMGATNRTEAAYKAQRILKNVEYTNSPDF
jgi:DNA-binding NarL/FixJ family response regulator